MVTGAGSGIGRAVAIRLAQDGASVGLLGRRVGALEATAAEISRTGGASLVLPADVSHEADMASAVDAIARAWGGLDVVVGVAGVELVGTGDARVDELELSAWRATMDINLTGMFLTCKHGIRALLRSGGGSVIITGSPCGIMGHCSSEHAYSASKAGTHGLVRVMAADYAREGIRVNGVIPGFIETPLNAPVFTDPAWLAAVEATIPMRRAGRAEEVAPLYAWLASDDSSYVTGAFFTADGGQTAI
jgi:NAD(P)-dependent dehydrogenase (short-subunit alcohol dehydrogenase family)